ncbi:hypothetical protein [Nocardia sp. NRRL WC-3656]|uniref:hypothetical protein n=1 Tax=Nocardia sp. NRRL WC-3656 TaxID=1463824 RepID=UPI00068997C9|nr:hypothetical protein [Nocardia sp. NRRL WC-3656]
MGDPAFECDGQTLRPRVRAGSAAPSPYYRAGVVGPYRDHLRHRRTEQPAVPVLHLFHKIKALGYTGRPDLLHKYLNQGRAENDRIIPSPPRLTSWIMSRPAVLHAGRRAHPDELVAACPEITNLARLVGEFASILAARHGNDLDGG